MQELNELTSTYQRIVSCEKYTDNVNSQANYKDFKKDLEEMILKVVKTEDLDLSDLSIAYQRVASVGIQNRALLNVILSKMDKIIKE